MSRNRHVTKQRPALIDVCILTAGRTDEFGKAIAAAVKDTANFDCEYYVLDNGSPKEKQAEYLQILDPYPQVNYHHLNENIGFPGGVNKLIRMGTAPLVFFISDDIVLHDGATDALVRRMDDKSIALCGMKLLFPEINVGPGRPAGKVQHVGHAINIRSEIIHVCVGWDKDNPKCCESREMLSVTGAAFMVRRKPFLQAGGFFDGYGKGTFEDVDLCFTLRSMGYKVWMDANAVATHYVGATAEFRKESFDLQRNQGLFMARHGSEMVWDEWNYW